MAIKLGSQFAISLGSIVESSLDAARIVHSRELATKEAAFQTAVAEGNMSYQAQLDYRMEQLAKEQRMPFRDDDYIAQINNSIASTKKLARFEKVRQKYTTSLNDYVSGKETLDRHITVLQRLINTEQDPELNAQLQTEMNGLIQTRADNEVMAIQNRSVVAQNDLSIPLIDKSIAEIKNRRAKDSLNGNEEAVGAWDQTLNSLNNSRSTLIVQNGQNEITYQTHRNNLKTYQQVDLIDKTASSANSTTPFQYNGVAYASEQDYWNKQRDSVINSPDFWSSLSADIDAESTLIAETSPSGQVPVTRIQEVNNFYNGLKTRSGFENYGDRIEQERTSMLDASVNELATFINEEASQTGDYGTAEKTVMQLEQTFGIKVTRLPGTGETSFVDQTQKAITEATKTPATQRVFTSIEDAQLKAAQDRINAGMETPQDKVNVEYAKTKGWSVAYKAPVVKAEATTATATPVTKTTGIAEKDIVIPDNLTGVARQKYIEQQAGVVKRGTTQVAAPLSTSTATVSTTTKPKYTGSSVVDYLRLQKQDTSFTARKSLAEKYGIKNYIGSGSQNTDLLKKLQSI